jgi:thymidine phosphorylase
LAAGLQSLVLDVKAGNGAFMANVDDARALAQSLVAVANGAGLKTTALITDMNEPLASAAGNALEVLNAVHFLTGAHQDSKLKDVTLALAGEMLASAGLAITSADGVTKATQALASGKAAEIFGQMVRALGGPADLVEQPQKHLKSAPLIVDVFASKAGFITGWDTRSLGVIVLDLGGGRRKTDDKIDHRVGLDCLAPLGAQIDKGSLLARIHAADEKALHIAKLAVQQACTIGPKPTANSKAILEQI